MRDMSASFSAVSDFSETYTPLYRLSPAIIGMLVVYCLKDVEITAAPFGLPELTALAVVAALQYWKRNSLISILSGTLFYMVLIRIVF